MNTNRNTNKTSDPLITFIKHWTSIKVEIPDLRKWSQIQVKEEDIRNLIKTLHHKT